MFERVLVALDGSALSETVLPWARRLLEEQGATVWLVYAAAPDAEWVWGYGDVGQAMYVPPPPADHRREGQAYLERMAADLGGDRVRTVVRDGEPAPVIAAVARETDARLIAMATHGRSGLSRIVLGSVADQVLRSAACPVLLIRPDPAALRAAEEATAARQDPSAGDRPAGRG